MCAPAHASSLHAHTPPVYTSPVAYIIDAHILLSAHESSPGAHPKTCACFLVVHMHRHARADGNKRLHRSYLGLTNIGHILCETIIPCLEVSPQEIIEGEWIL